MKMMKHLTTILLAMALLFAFAACGSESADPGDGNEYDGGFGVYVENQTGVTITDLRMSPENSGDWGDNRLGSVLYDGETVWVDLGELEQDAIDSGFEMQLFDDYDNTIGALDDVILSYDDTLTFSLYDDGSLNYAVSSSSEYTGEPETGDSGESAGGDFLDLVGSWYYCGDDTTDYYVFEDDGTWFYYLPMADGGAELTDYGYVSISSEFEDVFYLASEIEDVTYEAALFDAITLRVTDPDDNYYDYIWLN